MDYLDLQQNTLVIGTALAFVQHLLNQEDSVSLPKS